jgi:hypothetical protein
VHTIPAFYFDPEQLAVLAKDRAQAFRSAEPYPHLVLSDFLPRPLVERLVAEFPEPDDIEWAQWGPGRTRRLPEGPLNKLGQSQERYFGPFTRHFIAQLNSATFVSFLEQLTGIEGIIVDPTYNACGLHSTGVGGRLMIHTDTNRHPHSGHALHQVLNLILFLNDDWKEEYGGHLELWTRDAKPCVRIAPVANRAVLFSTGTRSFHGHPEPVACPPGRRRNSIAVYYYSFERLLCEDYEGMQRTVRWIPTSAEDREIAGHAAQRAEALLASAHGTVLPLARADLPFAVPGDPDGPLFLGLFLWSRLDAPARESLLAELAALLPDAFAGGAQGFLAGHRPFGFIASRERAGASDPDSLLALLRNEDSSVYIARRDTRQLLFYGYLDEILGMLSGRLLSQVMGLRAGA